MDREGFVAALNQDLELEYQSMIQYIQHIATCGCPKFDHGVGGCEQLM